MKQEPLLNSHLDAQDFASRDEALQQLTLGLGNKIKIGNDQPGKNVSALPSWPESSFVDEKTFGRRTTILSASEKCIAHCT